MNIEGAERLAIAGMADCVPLIQALCISCHDFVADEWNSEIHRTKEEIRSFMVEKNFFIQGREQDSREWIRDQLNATKGTMLNR